MQKIVPHIWFDKEAKEASEFYVSLFNNSKIHTTTTIPGTPSGNCDIVSFSLLGLDLMSISAGPYFALNPAISFFVTLPREEDLKLVWEKLSDGGKVLMQYESYPWSKKYGWVQDKYGLSWQLSCNEAEPESIMPFLMFTQSGAGKAQAAMEYYTSLFPNSSINTIVPYEEGDGDIAGYVKHARFTLSNQPFMATESTLQHAFTFNEAVSLIVHCDTQEEIDYFWGKLSHVPESEQCGWCKDKFGVSWQIVPARMNEMMACGDQEKVKRVTGAFLTMKKFNIAQLEEAYTGQ